MSTTISWKKHSVVLEEGLNYIEKRKNGEIKSLKSSWDGFNRTGLGGLDFGTTWLIGARPGIGKTLLSNSITRQLQDLNPDQDFYTLHFQFEMAAKNIAAREFSSATKLPLRYLLSANDKGMSPLSNTDLQKLKDYRTTQANRKEYVIDTPLTVFQMKKTIEAFYNHFKKPFIITLDHTVLIRQSDNENSEQAMLTNLSNLVLEVKNTLPVLWIILTQLNREIDDADRQIPGKLGNYPTAKDVYASDKLNMATDVLMAFNRPAKYNLKWYGPEKYIIEDKDVLAAHVIKNRAGVTDLIWFKADYSTMTFNEIPEPPKKQVTYGESGN